MNFWEIAGSLPVFLILIILIFLVVTFGRLKQSSHQSSKR